MPFEKRTAPVTPDTVSKVPRLSETGGSSSATPSREATIQLAKDIPKLLTEHDVSLGESMPFEA